MMHMDEKDKVLADRNKSKYLVSQIFGMFQSSLFQKSLGPKLVIIPCRTHRRKSTLPDLPAKEHPQQVQNPSRPWRLRVHPSSGLLFSTQHLPELILVILKPYIVYLTYVYCKNNIKQYNVTN